jgi:poly(3-hydroxybutyrate) depolymerase
VRILAVECPVDASVVLYIIDGGGHNWPGREPGFSRQIAGNVNMDIDAAEVIWQFFASHRREQVAEVTLEATASVVPSS